MIEDAYVKTFSAIRYEMGCSPASMYAAVFAELLGICRMSFPTTVLHLSTSAMVLSVNGMISVP